MAKKESAQPKVVVTTTHRGVFFGTLAERKDNGEVVLTDARVCVYWSPKTRGFVGLAATGPLDGSRVSPAAPRLELTDVTAILQCSDEAAQRWEAGQWA